ncbi:hypothetical protein ACH9L7_18115 (plasmid) [Haloferax sp. S1W]
MRTRTKLAAILVALLVLVTTLRSTSGDLPGDENETTADSTTA